MLKKRYHQHRKHCPYFSLYWTANQEHKNDCVVHVVASKKLVHKQATKRNYAKRRVRAIVRDFFKIQPKIPAQELVIITKKEVLTCSFLDLSIMLNENLRALLK